MSSEHEQQASTEHTPPAGIWRRSATVAIVAALAAGGVAAWTWGRPQPRTSEWRLVVDERFDRADALASGWRAVLVPQYQRVEPVSLGGSGWRVEGGALVGDDQDGRVADIARTDLPAGALRASWTVSPQVTGLNLNCFVGAPNRLDGYTVHIGGWGRPDYLAIGRSGGSVLDACTLGEPLRPGRTYRCEIEFDRGLLVFSLDGRPVLSCRDPEPLAGSEQGGIGFEVSWNTLRIDDLQVWVRPPERAVSPLAAADTLASTGAWRRAAAAYQSFARTWPDDPLVPVARLRGAAALARAGFIDEAMPVLTEVSAAPDPRLAVLARYERLRALAPGAADDVVDGLVARLAEAGPDQTVGRLALEAATDAAFARDPAMDSERTVALVGRLRHWASDLRLARTDEALARCAERLNTLGAHAEVVSLMPESTVQHVFALLAMARYDEVHRRFPDIQWGRYMAWSDTCGYEEGIAALAEPFLRGRLVRESGADGADERIASAYDRAFALAAAQGATAALERFPKEPDAVAWAMLEQERAADALAIPGIGESGRILALLQAGRLDEAAKAVPAGDAGLPVVRGCRAIAALAAGDAAGARVLAGSPAAISWAYRPRWASHRYDPGFAQHFPAYVLPALIAWQATGADPLPAWSALAAEQRQRFSLRVDHRWLGLLGAEPPEAVRQQPFRAGGHADADAALVAAIRADLARDASAPALWRAYLAASSPLDVCPRAWARLRLAQ